MQVWRGEGDFLALLKADPDVKKELREPKSTRISTSAIISSTSIRSSGGCSAQLIEADRTGQRRRRRVRRGHHFSKTPCLSIRLLTGLGVEGDAHTGVTVKHRSRVRRIRAAQSASGASDARRTVRRAARQRFHRSPGDLGENVTTPGVDLLALPTGTRLHLGATAVVEVTGLRNPCVQIDRFQKGLMAATLGRTPTAI